MLQGQLAEHPSGRLTCTWYLDRKRNHLAFGDNGVSAAVTQCLWWTRAAMNMNLKTAEDPTSIAPQCITFALPGAVQAGLEPISFASPLRHRYCSGPPRHNRRSSNCLRLYVPSPQAVDTNGNPLRSSMAVVVRCGSAPAADFCKCDVRTHNPRLCTPPDRESNTV